MTSTRIRSRRVWLGVGVAALVTAGGAEALPDAAANQASAAPSADSFSARPLLLAEAAPPHNHGAAAPGQGGEGGEGGESGGSSLPANIKFLRDIGLIRGHLLVGNELAGEGHWSEGLPHFLHPVEEIYEAIRRPLKEKHMADFDAALKALAQTVKSRKREAYDAAWERVDARLNEIERAEKAAAGAHWPQTTVATVLALLQSATGEYGQAIEKGRIAKPVEYQDSRGFVFYAGKLLASVSGDLAKINPEAAGSLTSVLGGLKAAWPTAVPPPKPVMDHAAVLAATSRFELAAGPFLNN